MKEHKDDLSSLYTALMGKGYSREDLGDENTFRGKMSDSNNRKQLYDYVSGRGDFKIGDYNTYERRLSGTPEYLQRPDEDEEPIKTEPTSTVENAEAQPSMSVAPQKSEVDSSKLVQSELSPYVKGKGEETEIFGVPYSTYMKMSPESQSYYYQQAKDGRDKKTKETAGEYIGSSLSGLKENIDAGLSEQPGRYTGSRINTYPGMSQDSFNREQERYHRYSNLSAAKDLIEDSEKILAESSKKGNTDFASGLGRGLKDKVFDVDTWAVGLTDFAKNSSLLSAVKKADKGEALSDEEQKLLDAAAMNMAVQAYFSSDLGSGYKAGQVTGESIPFMLEFALNPVSGSGNAIAKTILKNGLKRFGTSAGKKGVANALKTGTKKAVARIAGDAVAAAGMTGATGLGRVASGAVDRMVGDLNYGVGENGDFEYAGRENQKGAIEAFGKSTASTTIENFSEMFFNAFKGTGKIAGDVIEKVSPKGVNEFFASASKMKPIQLYRELKSNPTFREVAQRTQFHGLLEEHLEEVVGNLMNIPLGEMTLEQTVDFDSNIDILTGLAPTSIAFGALGLGGMSAQNYRTRRNLNRLAGGMTPEQKEMLDDVVNQSKIKGNEDVKRFIKETIFDESLTERQKREEVEYIYNKLQENASEAVRTSETEEAIEKETADIVNNSDASTNTFTECIRITTNDIGEQVSVPGHIVGWMGGTMVEGPDGSRKREGGQPIWQPEGSGERITLKEGEYDPASIQSMSTREMIAATAGMIREEAEEKAEREATYSPEVLSPINAPQNQGIYFTVNGKNYVTVGGVPEGFAYSELDEEGKEIRNWATSDVESPITEEDYYDAMQAQIDAREESANIQPEISKVSGSQSANELAQENVPTVPMDEKGNVLYHKMPVEDTITDLTDGTLDDGEVDGFVAANRTESEKILKKVSEAAPKIGTNKAKYLADKKVWGEKVADAKAQVEYWNEIDSQIRATRVQPGDVTAEAITSMGDPMNGEELAATMLGTGKLPLLYDNYKKELGFGNGDARGMFGLFAAKTNGGMSIEEAGEQLMLADAEGGTNFFDPSDPNAGRNAILDVLSGARTKGDLFGYIKNSREAMAERERQAELEAYELLIAKLAEDCHLTPEEFIAFEESIGQMIEERLKDVSDEELKGIFAELYLNENYGRSRESDEVGTGVPKGEERAGGYEGSPDVLSEEWTDDAGAGERGAEQPDGNVETGEPGDSVLPEAVAVEGRAEVEPIGVGSFGNIFDRQGNPIDENRDLIVEKIDYIEQLTDEDFNVPSRSVQLPVIPKNVSDAIGSGGKPVIIKKNIFEKNRDAHKELTPDKSRNILAGALYSPNIIGQVQPIKRPNYWVAIETVDKNSVVVLEVNNKKDNIEIVGWRLVDTKGLEKMKRQAEREGGQFLIQTSTNDTAAALSTLPSDLSSENKDSKVSENKQERQEFVSPQQVEGESILAYAARVDESRRVHDAQENQSNSENGDIRFRDADNDKVSEPIGGGVLADLALPYTKKREKVRESPVPSRPSYTIDNVLMELYGASYQFMGFLNGRSTSGFGLADGRIDTQKAKAFYSEFKGEAKKYKELLNEMRKESSLPAREILDDVTADVNYSLDYYKRLSNGEDVWRTENDPRFREVEPLEVLAGRIRKYTDAVNSDSIEKAVIDLGKELNTSVQVVRDVNEITDINKKVQARMRGAKGWFDPVTNEVTVNLSQAKSVEDARETVFHEVVAHYGLRKLFGEDFDAFLDNVYAHVSPEIRKGIVNRANERGNILDLREATEEYLAELAERGFENEEERTLWQKIKDAFIVMLRKVGVNLGFELTDNELRYVLWKSKQNLEGQSIIDRAADVDMRNRLGVGESALKKVDKTLNTNEESLSLRQTNNGDNVSESISQGEYGKMSEENSRIEEVVSELRRRSSEDAGNAPSNSEGLSERQQKEIENHIAEEYAKEKGVWIPMQDVFSLGVPAPSGNENDVYLDTKDNTVYKVNNLMNSKRISSLLERLKLHNQYFPQTKYELVGFSGFGGSDVFPVLKQDYIANATFATLEEINTYMGNLGFKQTGETAYSNGEVVISDLRPRNVLKDADGDVYVVDAEFQKIESDGDKRYRTEESTAGEEREPDGTIEAYETALKKQGFRAQEAFQDSMLALKVFQDVVLAKEGSQLKSFEDAHRAENRMSSVSTREMEVFEKKYFKPVVDEVARLIKDEEVSYGDITNYLIAKHGLERNVVLCERKASETADKAVKGEIDSLKRQEVYQRELEKNAGKDYSGLTGLMESLTDEKEGDFTGFAKQLVADFESGHDVKLLWNAINSATNKTLKKSYESGLMSREQYELLKGRFKNYVPLRGWDETMADEVYEYLEAKRSPVNSVMKGADGRKSLADDPIATMGNMAESAILQGNRNLMKQNFLNFVINHPSDLTQVRDAWYVKDNVSGEFVPSFPDIKENASSDEIAYAVEEHEENMKSLEKEELAQRGRSGLDLQYKILPYQKSEHAVSVKRNGQEIVVYVNGNPRAAQALNGLTNPDVEANPILRGISRFNRTLAANFTTRNPAFVFSNFVRDMIFSTSAVSVKESPLYLDRFRTNIPKSMATVFRGIRRKGGTSAADKYFQEFLDNGGETGYANLTDVDKYKKMIQKDIDHLTKKDYFKLIRQGLELFGDFNRMAEDVARFNTYMTSRQEGRSIVEAINDAKEVTVNFNKKGAGYKSVNGLAPWYSGGNMAAYAAGVFKSLYLFFNAGIQSLANFNALYKKNWRKFGGLLGGFTTAGFMMPFVNSWLMSRGGDDDDQDYYANLSEWTRRNNLCLYIPYSKGHFVTIPLPIELRAFYGLGDMAYQETVGNGGKKGTEIAFDAVNQLTELLPLNPLGNDGDIVSTVVPDSFKPIAQVLRNKDFTGKPIYKSNSFNETMPEWTKTYRGTSGWITDLSEWSNELGGGDKYKTAPGILNWNPAMAEHVLVGYFGGMAATLNQVGKTMSAGVESVINGEKSDDLMWRNAPVLSRFINDASDERSAFRGVNAKYFELYRAYDEVEKNLRGYSKEVASGNLDYLDKLNALYESADYRIYMAFKRRKSQLDRLREMEKLLPESMGEDRSKLQMEMNKMKKELVEEVK